MFLLDDNIISVYVVCILLFSIIEMNLFWFRFGFLEIIGRRGIMFGVFFFCDCVIINLILMVEILIYLLK